MDKTILEPEHQRYKPEEYKLGFKISKDMLEDKRKDIMMEMTKKLRESLNNLWIYNAYDVFTEYDEELMYDPDEDNFII